MEIFSDLLHFDHQLFLLINGAFPRDWLDPVMTAVTDMGNGAYQFPIGLLILILVSRQHLKRDVPLWASTALLSLLVGELLKKQIARPRPLAYFHDKIVDTVILLGDIPNPSDDVNVLIELITWSRLASGSPIPIKTIWFTRFKSG